MRRTIVLAALAALTLPLVALADRSFTLLSAPSRVASMQFTPQPLSDGGTRVDAVVCGQTTFSDGGATPIACWPVGLPQGNAINTSVMTLANGSARTFWMQQEGL